jgi:hypothetical protein
MDLIDRYLGAVRRNLPARGADDIVAELRDALASRVEEREERLGRPLTDEEGRTLVKDFGHPLVVAGRYRRQQWLIGPDVFPFYLMVVRIVLLAVAGVQAAIGLVRLLLGDGEPIQILLTTAGGLATSLLFSLAIVTFLFVVLERSGFPKEHLQIWNPAQLADLEEERQGQWEAAAEVAFTIAFLLWWAGVFHLPYAAGGADFRIEPAPVFAGLYWPILVLASVRLVHNLIQWLRPRWTLVRAVVGGLTAVGGLVLIALIYRAGQWATIVSTGMPAGQAAELQNSLNLALRIALIAIGIIWAFQCVRGLWVLSRSRMQAAPA